eukprot:scaffold268_cov210-Ochromonas_danica.AAC.61
MAALRQRQLANSKSPRFALPHDKKAKPGKISRHRVSGKSLWSVAARFAAAAVKIDDIAW